MSTGGSAPLLATEGGAKLGRPMDAGERPPITVILSSRAAFPQVTGYMRSRMHAIENVNTRAGMPRTFVDLLSAGDQRRAGSMVGGCSAGGARRNP